MTNEERVRQVQNGVNVCENMTALWLDNQPLIKSIVNRYPEKDREDLMQDHIKNCINAYLNLDRPVSVPKYILVLMQRDKRVWKSDRDRTFCEYMDKCYRACGFRYWKFIRGIV